MQEAKIFLAKNKDLTTKDFNPRNYEPKYLEIKRNLQNYKSLNNYLNDEIKGGSTPPYYFLKNPTKMEYHFVKHQQLIGIL